MFKKLRWLFGHPLDDANEYDIKYLYDLLRKNDWKTQQNYMKHMRFMHRLIYFSAIAILGVGAYFSYILWIDNPEENFRYAFMVFSFAVTFPITIGVIISNRYDNIIKNQIEYRKELKGKTEESCEDVKMEKVKKSQKNPKQWMNDNFQAIPYDIVRKAYLNTEHGLKPLMDDTEDNYLSEENFPIGVPCFYLVANNSDKDWIKQNKNIVSKCGFDIYTDGNHLFIVMDGTGYDLMEDYWIPLFNRRNLK